MKSFNMNRFESAIVEKFLAGSGAILDTLRQQARSAKVASRENTGAGFYTWFKIAKDSPKVESPCNFELSNVEAQIPGLAHGAGFVLFIRDGFMDNLEGFSYDEPWPKDISDFSLTYVDLSKTAEIGNDRIHLLRK